jgi:branched-chain amino acid transport system ATP-binding protein
MLKIDAVAVAIGPSQVLHEVSLEVGAGQLVALVGANGAGKTTLLRAVSGLLPLARGEVRLAGASVASWPAWRRARAGLVHVPQGRQVVPQLTVRDNLLVGAGTVTAAGGPGPLERMEAEFVRFPALRDRQNVTAGALSGGEQQMLAISRALMMRPRLLMLDEPSLGLAPRVVEGIMRCLRELADGGMAVLLVEQAAMAALAVADQGVVLRGGRVVLRGTGQSLLGDRELVRGFLG